MDARLAEAYMRLDTGESGALWRELRRAERILHRTLLQDDRDKQVTALDTIRDEFAHIFPRLLPNGRGVLFKPSRRNCNATSMSIKPTVGTPRLVDDGSMTQNVAAAIVVLSSRGRRIYRTCS